MQRERVFDRRRREEAAVRIDRVVAVVPEERRRDAGDVDVGDVAVETRKQDVLRLSRRGRRRLCSWRCGIRSAATSASGSARSSWLR